MIRPSYPTAGHPAARNPVIPAFRKSALPVLLVCTTALAGCATTTPPPEIAYDDAAPAVQTCLLYTSPSPRDKRQSRMPSSA